jgi:diguanylate cyclase (GGDEF)-like protein/PAS domain S-box-containing protein
MTEDRNRSNVELDVLVVAAGDDEASIRALLAGDGVRITACPGTHDAVARLAHTLFDAIVLSIAGARQLDAVAKLRARAPDVAMIALVGRQDKTLRELAVARGAQEALALSELTAELLHYALRLAVQRVRQDREQRAQTASLRTVFDLDAHPVWVCDPVTLKFISANRAAVETYGYSEQEFATMGVADIRSRNASAKGALLPPPGRPSVDGHRTKDGREIEVESFAQRAHLLGREVLLLRARDVTAERRAMRALEASERRFRDFFEHSTGFIFIHELDGTLLSVNPAAASALGRSVAELLGTPLRDLSPPHLRFLIDQYLQRIANGGEDAGQVRVQHRDGAELVWQYRNRQYTDADGSAYVMGYAQDITAMRAVELALQLSEQRLRTVADTLPLKIAYIDAQQRFVFVNEAFRRAYADGDDVGGALVSDVLGAERYARREPYLLRALAGERVVFEDEEGEGDDYQCVEVTFIPETAEKNGSVVGVHAMVQDITSKKREERRLIHLARIDPLTGLMNRAGFYERLETAISRSREKEWLLAVFYVDIDRFKLVNDTHGHAVGDALIRSFATRLGENVRASDAVARLGGDEFIVVMEGIPDIKRVRTIATKLVMAMSRPFELRSEGLTLSMGASIGVAAGQACQLAAPQLVARADAMLYEAKQAGRGTYRLATIDPSATEGRAKV